MKTRKRRYLGLSQSEKDVAHMLSMMCTEVSMRSRHAKEWAGIHNAFLGRFSAAILSRKYHDFKRGKYDGVPESELLRRLLMEETIERVLS